MNYLYKTIALVWPLIPPLLLSALIHSTDPDVGGLQGLASATTLLSVIVFSVPVIVVVFLCLMIWKQAGWHWSLITMLLFSGFTALFLTKTGSSATTPLGLAWTFIGSTGLVTLVLGLSVIPAAILLWHTPPSNSLEVSS